MPKYSTVYTLDAQDHHVTRVVLTILYILDHFTRNRLVFFQRRALGEFQIAFEQCQHFHQERRRHLIISLQRLWIRHWINSVHRLYQCVGNTGGYLTRY